ncbi:MAG: lipocalin family protein, partial [Draconibacterium sp.]
MRSSIIIAFFILFCNGCKSGNEIMNISTIQQLDLQQYLGTWYEVARYDHRFERGLVGVTATYSLRDDGKI